MYEWTPSTKKISSDWLWLNSIVLNGDETRRLLRLANHSPIELNKNIFFGFNDSSIKYADGKLIAWLNLDACLFVNTKHSDAHTRQQCFNFL